MALSAGTRLGPYEVLSALGAGGMGEVYKARDTRLDRLVAIKVLPPQLANDPQFRQRFEHEARAISALDHPHICSLYDIGEHDGTSFLVMQYLQGETLEARIKRAPLAVDQALGYAVQIAGALDRAHRAGIVHRDLKPGNVMLTKDGAKLLDFGLSKTTASGGAAAGLSMLPTTPPGLTAQGTILGTFQYMAPEQLEGHDADARTDIFAFGALLYEMLTAKKAFEGKSQASLIGAILKDNPPALFTLQPLAPRILDHVVQTCLAKSPDDRWQSARDLERELSWIAHAGSEAPPEPAKDRSERQLLVTRIVATLLGIAFASSIGVSILRSPNSARATDRHAIRFTVPTEANLFGNYYSGGFALSPDGRTLAYVDGTDPIYRLLTRSMETLEGRTLVTGDDVRQPFWSPDNRYIGFFSNGILKKVDVVDGTTQTVCVLPRPGPSQLVLGGAWGDDDTILFALRSGPDSLYRVSASGGSAAPLEIQRAQPLSFRWPQFLPGGRRFLHLGLSESGSGLYLSTFDGTASKSVKLMDTDYMSQYAEPGYLLFVRDGGLFAQPFNADTGSLSGTPVSLVQGIAVSPDVNLRNAGFSVAGTGGLVYRMNSSRKRLTWLDRAGNEQGVVGEPDNYDEAELSPDGSQIVAEVNDKNGFGEIWVMNAGRGTRVPLTRTTDRWEYSPRWSPDGRYIAYADGNTVRRRRSDGSGDEEKLADITPPSLIFPRDWTRDGRILFTRLSGGLFSLPASPNSQPSPLDDGAGNGRVSADGRWLAYTSFETGQNEVYVRSFAGGPRTRVSTEGGQSPVWRQTGSELYYRAADGSMMSVTIRNGESLDVGIPQPLFKLRVATEGVVRPLFSTIDGQRFLVRMPDAATAPPITWVVNWAALLDSALIALGERQVYCVTRQQARELKAMKGLHLLLIVPVMACAATAAWAGDDPYAAQLFARHCASCHEAAAGGAARIPAVSQLKAMTPTAILRTLETGTMRAQAAALSTNERQAVANFLGTAVTTERRREDMANPCPAGPAWKDGPGWSSWGANLANTRFQTAKDARLKAEDVPRLTLKWAFAFPDSVVLRSQPAAYRGSVFAGTQNGDVYALDAATGCVHWITTVQAEVRSGITVADVGGKPALFFGDSSGYLYGLDGATGKQLWKLRLDEHPAAKATSTPVFHQGRLYVGVSSLEEALAVSPGYVCCTFRGSVLAIQAVDGAILWKRYMIDESAKERPPTKRGSAVMGPSGVSVWTAPTLDPGRDTMYVTTGDNYSDPPTPLSDAVVALRMSNGNIVWSKQLTAGDAWNSSCMLVEKVNCPDSDGPDFDFAASAMLIAPGNGRRVLVLGQKSGMAYGLDPDRQGQILWQARVGEGGAIGGIEWGPATDGRNVYIALSDVRFQVSLAAGSNDRVYELDPTKGGGMFAFTVDNGERIWQTAPPGCGDRRPCSPAQSAAVTGIPGAVFSGSLDGHLRAYSTANGKILWDYDTAREFETVNGLPGHGGALDVGGPVVAGGMVFATSGSAQRNGLPGNVLLGFAVSRQLK